MLFLYNIAAHLVYVGIRLLAVFNTKLKLFVAGRRETFARLKNGLQPGNRVLWMHVASLGEYEQGLPLLKKLRQRYPQHKIVLSFFSPSGFEVVKDKTPADVVVYLPFDTLRNARKWLDTVQPELAVFVKYEFWPALLSQIQRRNIRLLSVSAIFRPSQVFFKPYGGWMRRSLGAFEHFFVQNETSVHLLKNIGIHQVSLAGDTRFDRVLEILERDNRLEFMDDFTKGKTCVVAGSTWPEDEVFWTAFVKNHLPENAVVVFAPHDVSPAHIQALRAQLPANAVLYSEVINGEKKAVGTVLVIDTIGLLTKVYSYADWAYVGGGMKQGLHNVLEPAVFGIPVVIGREYSKFQEAVTLVERGGVISVSEQTAFNEAAGLLFTVLVERNRRGKINQDFVEEMTGATCQILAYLTEKPLTR